MLFSFQRMAVSCFPGLKPLFIWGLHLLTKHITLNCCGLASNVWAHTVHMQRESELPRSCFNWMYASMWHSTSSFLFFCFSNWLGNPWKVSHKSQVFFFFFSFFQLLSGHSWGRQEERKGPWSELEVRAKMPNGILERTPVVRPHWFPPWQCLVWTMTIKLPKSGPQPDLEFQTTAPKNLSIPAIPYLLCSWNFFFKPQNFRIHLCLK